MGELPKAKGNKELKRYLLGDRLTQRQAILGKCADCMGSYIDGKADCGMPECTLYPFMPYGTFKSDTLKRTSQGKLDALAKARLRKKTDSLSV